MKINKILILVISEIETEIPLIVTTPTQIEDEPLILSCTKIQLHEISFLLKRRT